MKTARTSSDKFRPCSLSLLQDNERHILTRFFEWLLDLRLARKPGRNLLLVKARKAKKLIHTLQCEENWRPELADALRAIERYETWQSLGTQRNDVSSRLFVAKLIAEVLFPKENPYEAIEERLRCGCSMAADAIKQQVCRYERAVIRPIDLDLVEVQCQYRYFKFCTSKRSEFTAFEHRLLQTLVEVNLRKLTHRCDVEISTEREQDGTELSVCSIYTRKDHTLISRKVWRDPGGQSAKQL